MPVVRLLHPVPIVLEQINKGTTIYDEDSREPIQQASRPVKVDLQAQVKWSSQFSEENTRVGTVESASGYLLFLKVDLDAKSIVLQLEDRFSRIGTRDTDVYITRLRPVIHYPDHGGHAGIKAFFNDRQPSKQTRG